LNFPNTHFGKIKFKLNLEDDKGDMLKMTAPLPWSNQFSHKLTSTAFLKQKMNVLQAAIDSNNAGVSFMEMSRYDEALEVFRSAADLMYVVTQLMKVSSTDEGLIDSSINAESTSIRMKLEETREKVDKISASISKENQRAVIPRLETDCFLHTQGFYLSMPPVVSGDAIPCAIHSATILANMALTYHLAVPQMPCSDNTALRSAMTLYEMAYTVSIRVEQNLDSSRVIMATLNNMAHINHECGMYEESSRILNVLQEYIRHQVKLGNDSFSTEKKVYLLNAMFLKQPHGARAA
jgi:hypothetical protein